MSSTLTATRPNENPTPSQTDDAAALAFIQRWRGVTASELSTAQSFVIELCCLLDVPPPHPTPEQDYMFERPLTFQHGDGSTSPGRVDCYKRGHFVWESKKLKQGVALQAKGTTTKAFDDALLRARQQAEDYARALPASEGRPPFVAVLDVGHVIELYAEFTRSGGTYVPFPDPRSHRIGLNQLVDPAIRARLRALWVDPMSLDPSRVSARVTREVAAELAELAKSLEAAGNAPHHVAAFLTRSLFSMFAEDVGLLPTSGQEGVGSFVHLLRTYREQPATLVKMLKVFWAGMDQGGFNAAIAKDVLRFNGKLFKGPESAGYALELSPKQIDGLLRAALANWQEVEPAIFGTLLERALDPTERHSLGAHYTPRAYVERLVLPTVVEPLRSDWVNVQSAAVLLAREAGELEGKKREAKLEEARDVVRQFHHKLCTLRVLDPACGSGNFLYVTLEHLKRLEGEVLNQLEALGDTQNRLGLEGETVTLQQLRGIELNERAAALAELVLWIGWLQWHVRTKGLSGVAEPVVHDYGNIEHRDALLAYDRTEVARDGSGQAITRWDGVTFKKHPATGEDVPDESAQVPQRIYVNARPADWPAADFIVGNPPFIGNKRMRGALGDGYVEALRGAWTDMPDTADFVMFWWERAAEATRQGATRQFGFITTNSLKQVFNRKVVDRHLSAKPPLGLRFAIADHPWVDSANGAAVRIAMSVGGLGAVDGTVLSVAAEEVQEEGDSVVNFKTATGMIHSDLAVGANVASAKKLMANSGICFQGFVLVGEGFVIDDEQRERIAAAAPSELTAIRPWKNGRDLSQGSRGHSVIDLFPLTEEGSRARYPHLYQHLLDRVKPHRDQVARRNHRERWWIWGEARPGLRAATAGLSRIIVTNFAAKHRYFVFESPATALDHNMYLIGADDAIVLGVLSSQLHVQWMLRAGSTLEDRPTWINSTCFLPFPFPHEDTGLTPPIAERIRGIAEQLDAHRKRQQLAHEEVTLTGMYNVLFKLRRGEALTAKEKKLHELGLVSLLQTWHEELDAAVLAAYGWSDMGAVPWQDQIALEAWIETLLDRLVKLNALRSSEEAAGNVRWLRPNFQDPDQRELVVASQPAAVVEATTAPEESSEPLEEGPAPVASVSILAQPWPHQLPEQVRAVADLLASSPAPLDLSSIESAFKGKGPWKKGLPRILDTLEAVGRARQTEGGWRG
ncbi:DNA methyltransferase [Variovorax ureilyticus]|uniref:site-specific DNA-methyltransferase (adenine-specific) n=1 Tax=Variovorax ureilyticus TaxID=1836198 RepID=A0ABU8VTG8_9BURK